MVNRIPGEGGYIGGPQGFDRGFDRIPPKALTQAKERAEDVETRVEKVAGLLDEEAHAAPNTNIRPELDEHLRAIGDHIDALKKILPANSPVLDHLDTEFQFLSSHRDTFTSDQVTEFGLIAGRLTDELNM